VTMLTLLLCDDAASHVANISKATAASIFKVRKQTEWKILIWVRGKLLPLCNTYHATFCRLTYPSSLRKVMASSSWTPARIYQPKRVTSQKGTHTYVACTMNIRLSLRLHAYHFRMILITTSFHFPERHQQTDLCNRETLCSLWCRK